MSDFWDRIQASLPLWSARLAAVALLLLAAWLFDRFFIRALHRVLVRAGAAAGAVSFLFNTARAILLCAVILAVFQQLGIETTSVVAVLGVAGAALALSLQGFMSNFAAGLVLLGERMLRLGDLIEVGDVRGVVVEIQTLHIIVETAERVRVSLPNTLLINGPFRNHSALPTRRVQWLLPVPLGIDLGPIREELTTRLLADDRVLREPAPVVFVRDWALDKQTLAVQAWTSSANAQAVQDQMLESLGKVMERHVKPPSAAAAQVG
jgi:small conductance mechanosensitive channel